MGPILEREIWTAGFARQLVQSQPGFSESLACALADRCWGNLQMLKPAEAVRTLLDWAITIGNSRGLF